MSVKKIWLYDNQQSFGNGAEVNRETDSSAPNTPDKIRWQDEKLWPALYQGAVTDVGPEPTFVEPRIFPIPGQRTFRLGPRWFTKKNDEGIRLPVPYADGRKVHEIEWLTNEGPLGFLNGRHAGRRHDGSTRIGRHFERFNLFIDVERFINDYGDVYDLPMVHFNALLAEPGLDPAGDDNEWGHRPDGERGSDVILRPRHIIEEKFVTAIRDLYGLYIPLEAAPPPDLLFGGSTLPPLPAQGQNLINGQIRPGGQPFELIRALLDIDHLPPPWVNAQQNLEPWTPPRVPARGGRLADDNTWHLANIKYMPSFDPAPMAPPRVWEPIHAPNYDSVMYVSTVSDWLRAEANPDALIQIESFFWNNPLGFRIPEEEFQVMANSDEDYVIKVFMFKVETDAPRWVRGVVRVYPRPSVFNLDGRETQYAEYDIGFYVNRLLSVPVLTEDIYQELQVEHSLWRPNRFPGIPSPDRGVDQQPTSEYVPRIDNRPPPGQVSPLNRGFLDGFNKTYVDHFTSIDQALPESLVADAEPALLPSNPTVAIESAYNFELDDYERALHEVVVPNNGVRTIPNMYLLEDYTTTELDGDLPRRAQRQDHWRRLRDFVNIGGLIREPTRREREYFCAWTNEIVKVLPTDESRNDRDVGGYVQDFLDPSKAMRNIFIPPESKNFLNSVKPDRNNYPMYNTIRFSAGNQVMHWARRFRSRYLDKFFARARNEGVKAQFNTFSVENFGRNFGKLFSTNTGLSPQEFVVMDVLQYVHTFLAPAGPLSPSGLFLAAFLQKQLDTPLMIVGDTDSDHMLNEEFDIEQPELLHEAPWLSRYIRRLAKNNLRSYEQMLSGQEAPSQTIFYRIEKRLRDELVQSIFVPNVDDFFDNPGLFEYVDTQIVNTELRFGTELDTHYYDIYAVRMILGNEYRRNITTGPLDLVEGWNYGNSNLETLNDPDLPNLDDLDIEAFWDDDNRAKIRIGVLVENTPSVKLVEVPIFKSRGVHTIDKPPLPPNVEFYSYEGVDNEVGIRMSMLAGTDVRMSPIPFNSREAELFRAILDEQRRNGITGNKVVFGNDDTPLLYEVRRLDSAPRSYEDFQDQPRHYTAHLGTAPLQSDAHFFIDSVTPNKKYYYIFRTLDTHELVSNPSSIYEVELVENAGAVYLLSEVYQLPEEKPNFVKDLQQYLKIKPSIIQSSLNERASGLVDEDGQLSGTAFDKNITLGPDANSVWNKKLKFRITSKKTGRKIDINLDFKTKQDTARGDAADDVLGCSAAPDPPPAVPPRPLPGDVDLVTGEVIQVPTPPVASPGLLIGAPPKQNLPSNGGKDS